MKKGFTIIEVLVVTLIMGILAAVAMPQYRKAIEHSRAAEPPVIWRHIEKMARISLPGGVFTGNNADDRAVCDQWYREAGLTPIGGENSHYFRSRNFVYYNETCGRSGVSMGVSRTNEPAAALTGGLYQLSAGITKSGLDVTSTPMTCTPGSFQDACEWF